MNRIIKVDFTNTPSVKKIKTQLEERVLELAHVVSKGKPVTDMGNHIRIGNNNSLAVYSDFSWHSFKSDKGGSDLFSLICHQFKYDFPEALKWAQDFVKSAPKEQYIRKTDNHSKSADHENTLEYAKLLWDMAESIKGTNGRKYLRKRGINFINKSSLKKMRFLSNQKHSPSGKSFPCLLLRFDDKDGNFAGILRIYIAKDGGSKADVKPNKMLLGSVTGSAIQFTPVNEHLVVAEGAEDALSILCKQRDLSVWCALGSHLGNFQPPKGVKKITIAGDNDDAGKGFAEKLASRLIDEGFEVEIMLPVGAKDFNQMLQEEKWEIITQGKNDIGDKPDMSIISDYIAPTPDFPLEAFGKWSKWIAISAKSKSAPVDFVSVPLLCTAAGLISNVRRGSPEESWVEPTILWCALIGLPSSNKSPALDIIINPIRLIENELAEVYKNETLKKYESEKAKAKIHNDIYQDKLKKALTNKDKDINIPDIPPEALEPSKPTRPRLAINDTTIEKACDLLMANKRGLILFRDELSGFLDNLGRHGGSDREFYLEGFGGRPYSVDRVKHGDSGINIKHLSISIVGGIQPDKVDRLLKFYENDGLSARFLYSSPKKVPLERPTEFPDQELLYNSLKRLHTLLMHDGEFSVVKFTKEASDRFFQWRLSNAERETTAHGIVLSFIGKMPGVVVRIATVLTFLDWAYDGKNPEPEEITIGYLNRAIKLVDDYFIPMTWCAFAGASLPEEQINAKKVAKWIILNDCREINIREFSRKPMSPITDSNKLEKAVEFLEECNWLKFTGTRKGNTAGRPSKTYAVNPEVFENL